MKILHLVQKPQLRGAEVFTAQLATQINLSGHEAVIVFVFPGKADLPFEGQTFSLNGNSGGRFWDFHAWKKLARIIKEQRPSIIQANAGDTLKYAVFSKLIFGWRQPIFFRNASTISLYIKSPLAKRWNSFFFRFADKIISVSKTSAVDFARLFPEYKERIITIPIGINQVEGEKSAARLPHVKPVLIHVGGFTFEKNHVGLIDIFERVSQKVPGALLHLIGDGPLKKQTEEIVQRKGLDPKIKFFGFQSNAMEHIRNADVLLLPSHIEGLPGVILEAFYCKTAVVAYDVGGIKEVVINNETGRLVKKGDENEFANEVIAALGDDAGNKKLIENAYNLVIAEYLNPYIAKCFLNVYESTFSE